MQGRPVVVLGMLTLGAFLPVTVIANCQGGGGAPVASTSSSAASSGGSGGSTVFFFDAGALGGMPPDGGCSDAATDASLDAPTGCEGIEGGVTWEEVGAILSGCQGEVCHSAPTYASTVDQPASECCNDRLLVDPGNAANSYLFDKVEGQDLCFGARMPFGEPPLPDVEILTIRRWICEGAPGP